MKKIMKFILGFAAATFIIIAVFWGSFVYVSNYKITKADWFFMRAKAEYPKQALNCLMMAEVYAAAYGRLHGIRTLWKLFCPEMSR